ncbi:MAG: hypothetical protein V7640_3778 [Betaproteobacteria bacterium]
MLDLVIPHVCGNLSGATCLRAVPPRRANADREELGYWDVLTFLLATYVEGRNFLVAVPVTGQAAAYSGALTECLGPHDELANESGIKRASHFI